MSYRIVIDSCGELPDRLKNDPNYIVAPLTLDIGGEQIIDDEHLQQATLLKKISECPTCPKSACPAPEFYKQAFDCEADHIWAITLSSELSGSYNSAELGRRLLMEKKPDRHVHVFNSRSASIGETLIALKIEECETIGMSFKKTIETVDAYIASQHTYFVLENLDTLRKNGRLSNLKAILASALKIKPILGSTDEGAIAQLGQARGVNKALLKMVSLITEEVKDADRKILAISHCNCRERAESVRDAIMSKILVKDTILLDTGGLSSLYANDGGVIVVI